MRLNVNGNDSHITVGLDIGSSTITCAIGQMDSKNECMKLLGISTTSSKGIRRGTITNRDELIGQLDKVLTESEMMAGTKVSQAILSITGEHIRCLNTQAAIALNHVSGAGGSEERAINDDDIHQVLNQAQAISLPSDRDILHTLPQEYLVDTLEEIKNPVGMTGRRLEARVHLVTAARTAMNNLVSCVEELGITVEGLVFQPLASAMATLKEDEMELGVTLVEIGASTTNIAVYHGSAIRHSAIIPIGASSITNDIAVMLQISIEEAEKIKMKYASARASMSSEKLDIDIPSQPGQLERAIPEHEVSRYVEARMQEIFQLIIREISRADIKDPMTYGIVITGGGALLRNIISLAESSLGVKVREGKSEKISGAQDLADGPGHATAIGLLLWPLFAQDHIRIQHHPPGFKDIFKKIRHTIENLF